MSALIQSFLANNGRAKCIESLEKDTLKGENLLLLGGFVEEFACALNMQGIHLESLESQEGVGDSVQVFLLHPLNFNPYPKIQHFLYEVGCEEAIVALLANALYRVFGVDWALKEFVESLDIGYLASECNLSEEELEQIAQSFKAQKSTLVLGKDLSTHKRAHNIGKILALLSNALPQMKILFLESLPTIKGDSAKTPIDSLEELECYDGMVAYLQTRALKEPILEVSKQFSQVGKIQEETKIEVRLMDAQKTMEAILHKSAELKGMVGILWIPQTLNYQDFWDLNNEFCYKKVKISKVA